MPQWRSVHRFARGHPRSCVLKGKDPWADTQRRCPHDPPQMKEHREGTKTHTRGFFWVKRTRGMPLTICLIGKYFPIQGGVSKDNQWLAYALASAGFHIHVVTNADEVESQYRCLPW